MSHIRKLHSRKRVALVAHDNKKKDLIEWAIYNKTVLSQHELIATGTTGKLLEEHWERPVKKIIQRSVRWRPTGRRQDCRRKSRSACFLLGPYGGPAP